MNDLASQMARELAALGVRRGGVLLVHSSLRSLGKLPDGPETAIEGFLEAVGTNGTLLMPALSYATVNAEHPSFDVLRTPSCVGAMTEFFRNRAGTLRSVHPTHSACGLGSRAGTMLGGHIRDQTPCGPNSPFCRLKDVSGQILFVGCGLKPNTSMHAVEELVEPPYLYGDWEEFRISLADGSETTMRVRRHAFKGWAQRYDRIEAVMGSEGIRAGRVLSADCFLLEAPIFWRKAHEALSRDPLFFVDRIA